MLARACRRGRRSTGTISRIASADTQRGHDPQRVLHQAVARHAGLGADRGQIAALEVVDPRRRHRHAPRLRLDLRRTASQTHTVCGSRTHRESRRSARLAGWTTGTGSRRGSSTGPTRRRTPTSTLPPRLVTHIDDGAIAAVGALYAELGITGDGARPHGLVGLALPRRRPRTSPCSA